MMTLVKNVCKASTVLIMLPALALAQERVAGQVTDANGRPLAQSIVSVQGLKINAETDMKGKFVLTNVPPGTHTIYVWAYGYTSLYQDIAFPVKGPLNLSLEEKPLPVRPYEKAWLDRWGLNGREIPGLSTDALYAKARVHARAKEMSAAAREGDAVAQLLVLIELGKRCNGGAKVSRTDCVGLSRWVSDWARRPPAPELSDSMSQWDVIDLSRGVLNLKRFVDIGKLFEYGVGGARDYAVAKFFYEFARGSRNGGLDDRQIGEAVFRLGVMAEHGLGGPKDPRAALDYYRTAADHYQNAAAAYIVAFQPEISDTDRRNYFETAADGGIADAAYQFAHMLETRKVGIIRAIEGPGATPETVAFKYYMMAALKGIVPAMSGVARAYFNGWGVEANENLAEDWWTRAAKAGDAEASYHVALARARQQDWGGAMSWARRSADAGYPKAHDLYQQWYRQGAREKSIGSGLLNALRYIGDMGAAMQQQQSEEMAAQQALWQRTFSAMYSAGSSDLCCIEYDAAHTNANGAQVQGSTTNNQAAALVDQARAAAVLERRAKAAGLACPVHPCTIPM